MPDDRKKPTGVENDADDGFRVEVPDDLLEEAVSAVDRRVAQSKSQVNTGGDDDGMPAEVSVDMSMETSVSGEDETDPGFEDAVTDGDGEADAPDIENMSVDELLNSGFLPDKIVAAFLDERTKAGEMKKQADAAKEKIASFLAESESFRKRLTREKDEALKFANEKVLKEILPVVDNLERALAHAGGDAPATSIREGIEITLRQANHVMEKLGVTRVEAAVGIPFDPRFHEAVSQQENKDIPVNSIAMVLQAGFVLHDRLLRPAMVAVAKGGPQPQQAKPADASIAREARASAGGEPAAPAQPATPTAPAAPEATAAPTPPASPVTPAAETPEQRLERIRKTGQQAREARLRKREEAEQAKAAAKPAEAPKETPEEKADRLRKTGQAAREARLARKAEKARKREAEQSATAAPAPAASETPEEKLERIRKTGQAARQAREAKRRERDRGDAQSVAAAEQKAAATDVKGETPEQKLERIRKIGEAAREARRKKREAAEAKDAAAERTLDEDEAAESSEAATTPPRTETPDEKLERIRKTGQAAREARRKRREAGSTAKPASPLAGPAFEDGDLDSWETTVDSIRTDKS